MSKLHNGRRSRLFLPLAIAFVIAGIAPAAAQTEPTGLQKFFGAMGLLELPKDPIIYRERAPLVVPPSAGLIPPRSAEDIRQINPDWPTDHDDRPRSARDIEAEKKSDEVFYSGDRVGVIELQRQKLTREQAARRGSRGPELSPDPSDHLGPEKSGFRGWGNKKEETVVFTGEPERRSLVEPPPGLRTPSQNAPYGIVTKSGPAKTVIDRSAAAPNDPGR